jgi:hypothetical protein
VLRERLPLVGLVSVAAVAALTVAAFAYDSSRDDLVAKGVRVAGVDIGGLRSGVATAVLERSLRPRVDRPVRVAVAGRRFRLTPKRASLSFDVGGTVDEALDHSRSGGVPGRVWRGLTGSRVEADLGPRVSYSAIAVRRFVARVKHAVDRPPRDADVRYQTTSLPAVPSRTGLRVSSRRLLHLVEGAIFEIGSGRAVRIGVRITKPKVTTAELGAKHPYTITVDRGAFKLRFFLKLRLAKTYPIAVGQVGLETPAGLYHVQDKAINPAWHVPNRPWAGKLAGKVIPGGVPENPLKSRWLGIYAGAGIHGTAEIGSLGSAASHGCIRMAIPDVEELYDKVPIGTPVYIQ